MLVTWYIPIRLSALGVTLTKEEHELFENQTIMDNFLTQVQEMMSRCVVVDDTIIRNYSGLVFEGAQGLRSRIWLSIMSYGVVIRQFLLI